MHNSLRQTRFYRLAVWAALCLGAILVGRMSGELLDAKRLAFDDFGHFWAAAWLNNHGRDPYDVPTVLALLPKAEWSSASSRPVSIMLNPPWALSLVMPFAFLNFALGRTAWLLLNVGVLLVCSSRLWEEYQGSPRLRWLAWFTTFSFTPTLYALHKGQLTPLVLLGLVGFVCWAEAPRRGWLGGACAALVAVKPQLACLVWVALVLWVWDRRRWDVLSGLVGALVVLTLPPVIANPDVLAQYFRGMAAFPIAEWATPTIGGYLRYFLGRLDQFWLQFLPSALGLVWFLRRWAHAHRVWNWAAELPMLLLISVVTSPYAWSYDLVVLIPAVIHATVVLVSRPSESCRTATILVLYVTLNALNVILHIRLDDFWFVWLPLSLLLLYLAATFETAGHSRQTPEGGEGA